MCRILLITLYLSSLVIAVYLPEEKDAVILRYDIDNYSNGKYKYSYETSNGIKRTEFGQLVKDGDGSEYIAVKGYYAYTDPDGKNWITEYTADKNGYQVIHSGHEGLDEFFPKPEEDGLTTPGPVFAGVPPPVLASLLGK